jgi:hypothetical protein
MSRRAEPLPVSFTTSERALIRQEMSEHFGQHPNLADGIFLRTWRGGPQKGQPKIPQAVQSMLERGLVEIRKTERGPRAFFTEAGLQELRRLLLDRRYMDPVRCGQVQPFASVAPVLVILRTFPPLMAKICLRNGEPHSFGQGDQPSTLRFHGPVLSIFPAIHGADGDVEVPSELLLGLSTCFADQPHERCEIHVRH